MPIIRNYNPRSIVYFQEDMGEEIFILQKGDVLLISTPIGEKEERREKVKVGEFFGVKSVLGCYPREETAQALSNTNLVVFKQKEFEAYISKNTRIIVQMTKVFSSELREIHKRVRSVLNVGQVKNTAFELLSVGESFYRNHNLDYAAYAFQCYLKNHSEGKNKERVMKFLGLIQKGTTYPATFEDPQAEEGMVLPVNRYSEQTTSDTDKEGSDKGYRADSNLITLFETGQKFFEKNNTPEAIKIFTQCISGHNPKTQKGKELVEKASCMIGSAYLRQGDYKDAILSLSLYIKKYPTGEFIRSCIYQLGVVQEKQGNGDKARVLYHKVATMKPHDIVTSQARKKLQNNTGIS